MNLILCIALLASPLVVEGRYAASSGFRNSDFRSDVRMIDSDDSDCNTGKDTCIELKVLSYNIWDVPNRYEHHFGYETIGYKDQRMHSIAKLISKGEFDLYLLQEVLVASDYEKMKSTMPDHYHITKLNQPWYCMNGVLPDWLPIGVCSGLTIVSKYPFKRDPTFHPFDVSGYIFDFDSDGIYLMDYWMKKGILSIRIEPLPNVTVDVFNTHTHSGSHQYGNWYRVQQVEQLMSEVVDSDADFVIAGGDFNAVPNDETDRSYQIVSERMENTAEVSFPDDWMTAEFATWGHKNNSFSKNEGPHILDYIFNRLNSPKKINASVTSFELHLYHDEILMSRLIEDNNGIANNCTNPWDIYHNLQKIQPVQNRFKDIEIIKNILKTEQECKTENTDINKKEKLQRKLPINRYSGITKLSLSDHDAISATMKIWKQA